jgi:Raf kinase inhibitor-like YbhB/YbcL family protein
MKIKSVFGMRERIPEKHTCDGADVSPSLELIDVPPEAKSLVLIVDDPDSPSRVWSHWVLCNIPPLTKEITEGSIPRGTIEGINDFGKVGYGGPCPHKGTHRYQFKLFALDTKLDFSEKPTKPQVEEAMQGHIIDKTLLIGIYSRVPR